MPYIGTHPKGRTTPATITRARLERAQCHIADAHRACSQISDLIQQVLQVGAKPITLWELEGLVDGVTFAEDKLYQAKQLLEP